MLLVARLLLAGVFATAVLAKLADPAGVRRAMVRFGIPASVAAPSGWALLAGELATAAALAIRPVATAGALAALGLLAAITAVIAANVARGQTPSCHCFGRLSTAPIGFSTLARNALFATVAGYVAAGGKLPLAFAAAAAVAAGFWVGLGPLGSTRRPRGALAPSFSLLDRVGATWTLEALLAHRAPVLLVFSHPACGACGALLSDVSRWQNELGDQLTIAVVSGGSRADNARDAVAHGLRTVLADRSGLVARGYGVAATPSAVLVDRERRIASATARGAGEIAELVGETIDEREAPRFARRGLIGRAAFGIASLGGLPLVASACGTGKSSAKRPKALHVAGTYVCEQRYALCTNAACVPSTKHPGIAICDCAVESGYSIGFTPCAQRAPSGTTLFSTFSTQLATRATRVMTCPASSPWANCLDVICALDPRDPRKARCECQLVETGPSVTFGGGCNTKTCTSVIWSAASSNLAGSTQLQATMRRVGQPLAEPGSCPSQ